MEELRPPVCYLPDGTLSTRPRGLTYKNSGTSIITPYSNLLGSWIHIIWRTSLSCKGYCSIWIYLIPEFSIRNLFENLSEFIQFLSSDNESSNKEEDLYFLRKWRTWSTPFLFVCMFLILPPPSLRSHMNEMSLFAQ